jgi:putative oxidoreductase
MLRDLALLGSRSVLGGYLAAHGAQKLFGALGGHGLEGTGGFLESLGISPGKEMAAAAGAAELGGGTLTVLGHLHPTGPVAIASTMGVAAATAHRGHGPFAADGGPELPLANLAAAVALATCDPGRFTVGKRLPRWAGAVLGLAGAAAAVALTQRARAAQDAPAMPAADEPELPSSGTRPEVRAA